MRLLTLHKVVIAASIVACLLFGLWAIWTWVEAGRGAAEPVVMALLAAAVAVALTGYLIYFISRTRRRPSIARPGD